MAIEKTSYLEQLSQIELAQIAEIELVKVEGGKLIDAAKQEHQNLLANVQKELAQRRPADIERMRNEAELMANELVQKSSIESKRLRTALELATPEIVDAMFQKILPLSPRSKSNQRDAKR